MYAKSAQPTRRDKAEASLEEVVTQLTNQNPHPHTVFHFTGHGSYDFDNPIDSYLALSRGDRLDFKRVASLNLNSYKLACLCACETAITGNQTFTSEHINYINPLQSSNGEDYLNSIPKTAEYVGIASTFMYSGVANVVSTLWTVESISSAILMVEFHRHYLAGTSAAIALATAKNWLRNATSADLAKWYQNEIDNLPDKNTLKSLLRRQRNKLSTMEPKLFNHPYYWAAFTISGL